MRSIQRVSACRPRSILTWSSLSLTSSYSLDPHPRVPLRVGRSLALTTQLSFPMQEPSAMSWASTLRSSLYSRLRPAALPPPPCCCCCCPLPPATDAPPMRSSGPSESLPTPKTSISAEALAAAEAVALRAVSSTAAVAWPVIIAATGAAVSLLAGSATGAAVTPVVGPDRFAGSRLEEALDRSRGWAAGATGPPRGPAECAMTGSDGVRLDGIAGSSSSVSAFVRDPGSSRGALAAWPQTAVRRSGLASLSSRRTSAIAPMDPWMGPSHAGPGVMAKADMVGIPGDREGMREIPKLDSEGLKSG